MHPHAAATGIPGCKGSAAPAVPPALPLTPYPTPTPCRKVSLANASGDAEQELYSAVQHSAKASAPESSASTSTLPKPGNKPDPNKEVGYRLPWRSTSLQRHVWSATSESDRFVCLNSFSQATSKTGYITRKVKKSKKWKPMYFALDREKRRLYFYDNECVFWLGTNE